MTVEAALAARFERVWRSVGARDDGMAVVHELLRAWQEPQRHYHGLDHLVDCLAQLDAAPPGSWDRDLAEIVLWFHDAVYRPGASDNEERSAAWARAALEEAGVEASLAAEADRLVRITDHGRPPTDPTGTLICDVDLSILGRPTPEYEEYERRIRAEYAGVPEALFRPGRRSVLSRLLARDPLFRTAHFQTRYEAQARRNLQRSLDGLDREA